MCFTHVEGTQASIRRQSGQFRPTTTYLCKAQWTIELSVLNHSIVQTVTDQWYVTVTPCSCDSSKLCHNQPLYMQ